MSFVNLKNIHMGDHWTTAIWIQVSAFTLKYVLSAFTNVQKMLSVSVKYDWCYSMLPENILP